MKIKKIVWLLLGLVGLGLGALGAVLPLLPSVPFLMLALFSFVGSMAMAKFLLRGEVIE